jgi:hypothetical protein
VNAILFTPRITFVFTAVLPASARQAPSRPPEEMGFLAVIKLCETDRHGRRGHLLRTAACCQEQDLPRFMPSWIS